MLVQEQRQKLTEQRSTLKGGPGKSLLVPQSCQWITGTHVREGTEGTGHTDGEQKVAEALKESGPYPTAGSQGAGAERALELRRGKPFYSLRPFAQAQPYQENSMCETNLGLDSLKTQLDHIDPI